MSDYKLIKYGKDAREALKIGADKLANAVVATYGPRSNNVAVNQAYPGPIVLHDGVSVAESIKLRDPFEDMGAALLREAASKTNDLAGDGTTTATLLGNFLIQEGFELIEGGAVGGVITGKINAMKLREKLLEYSPKICELLDKKAIKVEKIAEVAKISSGNDEVAKLVTDAFAAVGADGLIMVEQGVTFESSVEVEEGMQFDNGFLSRYFVTDPDRNICEYQDGYVLLTDYRIADPMQLVPIVTKVIEDNNKPLLVIADDVVGPALQALVLTKLKAKANLVAVIAPEFADRRKQMLEDIAVLTGGNVIARDLEKDKPLDKITLSDLGRFKSIRVTDSTTAITPKNPDAEEIAERIAAIKTQIDQEENAMKKSRLEMRLAKLSSKVAVISVGGASSTDIREKKDRCEDAVYATKAAVAEGIIPGGGVALRDIALELFGTKLEDPIERLVYNALITPFKKLLENAGLGEGTIDWNKGKGINLITGENVDMLEAGIIDAVKVVKLAIMHSFSVAALALTNAALITDDLEADRGVMPVRVAK
jgi:chaperonin GroEL